MKDNQWNEFQSILETLYENVDNPEHTDELKQIYDQFETTRTKKNKQQNIIMSAKLERFFSESKIKLVEGINFDEIQQHQQFIDQNSNIYKLKMLETSFKNMPQGSDYYPPPSSKEKLAKKSLFPKYKMLTYQIFPRLENETLFYIFYYYKEDYEQYLAFKELRNRGWLFHKKFVIWLKKSEPKAAYEVNDKFIKGQFIYFDYDKGQFYQIHYFQGWISRKKNDFTFKHQYLIQDND